MNRHRGLGGIIKDNKDYDDYDDNDDQEDPELD